MKKILAVIFAAALLCSCGPRLVILHTNDTHSHLETVRGGENDGMGGIIERAAYVDRMRARYGEDRVLLLHAGDFNQGTSYYTELKGTLEVEMVNLLGYDCIALGNHEFDNGLEDLAARVEKIGCPVVCANIDVSSIPLRGLVHPYAVIERAGMKIGVVGVTSDLLRNVSRAISSRVPQLDNVEVVNHWAAFLKQSEDCDMVILLSHLGYETDMELVPQIRNVDAVVGGHSHTDAGRMVRIRDLDGKKVPVVTDWCWGMTMGKLVLE